MNDQTHAEFNAKQEELEIKTDILDSIALKSIQKSAKKLLDKIEKSNCAPGNPGEWTICDCVWPAYRIDISKTPCLVLSSLERIGGSQGKSGGRVMIGYFIEKNNRILPSFPMIIKISKPADRDKLAEENQYAMSIRPYVGYNKEYFAMPLHFDRNSGDMDYSVLWSPFSSSNKIWDNTKIWEDSEESFLSLELLDLKTLLQSKPDCPKKIEEIQEETKKIIENVFQLLKPLHRKAKTAFLKEINIIEEYTQEHKDYLRDIEEPWSNRWKAIWADESIETTQDLGHEWTNPFWVLKKLKSLDKLPLFCGVTHGDLHPLNIVLSEKSPRIIDFGWTDENSHIAKDFVLLECNLRFVFLQPDISFQEITNVANWISFSDEPPISSDVVCSSRIKLIQKLRAIAKSHFPNDTNWDTEYILPLFLVSFGLLKFLSEYENQLAARISVLTLATYVKRKFFNEQAN